MDAIVTKPLNQISNDVSSLVSSLTTTPTYATAPGLAHELLLSDGQLSQTLDLLRQHQSNYAYILNLRAEALLLENQLKVSLQECFNLRDELVKVCPSALNRNDDGEETKAKPVDYEALLLFARRIGKHNSIAEQAAEKAYQRAKVTQKEKAMKEVEAQGRAQNLAREISASQYINETTSTVSQGTTVQGKSTHATHVDGASQSQENRSANQGSMREQAQAQTYSPSKVVSEGEQAWLNEQTNMRRAMDIVPFPDSSRLRMGELGRLQLLREQRGEANMERDVEKEIAEAEGWPTRDAPVHGLTRTSTAESDSAGPLQAMATRRRSSIIVQGPVRTTAKKKSIDLDLWDDDDDDDDD